MKIDSITEVSPMNAYVHATVTYKIKGFIIEVTSAEKTSGEIAAKREITLDVEKIYGSWIISNVVMGKYK